jgi:putative spermidine/putrescine transport system ATP-binding protein
MSDRIAVFCDGRIQQLGAPKEIYENPANSFVASFIGENNIITGTLVKSEGPRCAVRLENGFIVFARKSQVIDNDVKAVLSIRPEKIFIGNCGAESRVEGTIADIVYHGDHTRLRLRVPGTPGLVVKIPTGPSLEILELGRPVTISWKAADCIAFEHR